MSVTSALLAFIASAVQVEGMDSPAVRTICGANGLAVEPFASGRQSILYLVTDRCCSLTLILKLAQPGTEASALRREAYFLDRVTTPSFPRMIAWSPDPLFLCLEHIRGSALATLSSATAVPIVPIVVRALAGAVHHLTARHRPILHRDITPRQIIIGPDRVVILDFGTAEHEGDRLRRAARPVARAVGAGLQPFQPPEQLLGDPYQDRAVDVFAAASVIYWMLIGFPPYRNDEPRRSAVLRAYRHREGAVYRSLRGYPRSFQWALMDALRADHMLRSRDLWALDAVVRSSFGRPAFAASGG